MPSSTVDKIPFVVKAMMRFVPKSVVDIGMGYGKYGLLAREYLELWGEGRNEEPFDPAKWKIRIVGIDSFAAMNMPHHRAIYNEVCIGDICELVMTMGRFDLALLCDVIEHIEKERALAMLAELRSRCTHVIITAPVGYRKQGAVFGNPFEKHVSAWTAAEFQMMGFDDLAPGAKFIAVAV